MNHQFSYESSCQVQCKMQTQETKTRKTLKYDVRFSIAEWCKYSETILWDTEAFLEAGIFKTHITDYCSVIFQTFIFFTLFLLLFCLLKICLKAQKQELRCFPGERRRWVRSLTSIRTNAGETCCAAQIHGSRRSENLKVSGRGRAPWALRWGETVKELALVLPQGTSVKFTKVRSNMLL